MLFSFKLCMSVVCNACLQFVDACVCAHTCGGQGLVRGDFVDNLPFYNQDRVSQLITELNNSTALTA